MSNGCVSGNRKLCFDPSKLKTEADWISAGKLVFEAPLNYADAARTDQFRNLAWYESTRVPVTREGVMPFLRYFVRKKGVVEVGTTSCAQCHTRVLADGSVLNGAQGNFPFPQAWHLNALVCDARSLGMHD